MASCDHECVVAHFSRDMFACWLTGRWAPSSTSSILLKNRACWLLNRSSAPLPRVCGTSSAILRSSTTAACSGSLSAAAAVSPVPSTRVCPLRAPQRVSVSAPCPCIGALRVSRCPPRYASCIGAREKAKETRVRARGTCGSSLSGTGKTACVRGRSAAMVPERGCSEFDDKKFAPDFDTSLCYLVHGYPGTCNCMG